MASLPPARRLSAWLPPLAAMTVIFSLSASSNPMPAVTAVVWDKLLHGAAYAGLAVLFARALAIEGFSGRALLVTAVLLASAYGVTDEYHQSFVPNRQSDVADWLADTCGAIMGSSVFVAGVSLLGRRANTEEAQAG
jgi:VanZ family protein